MDEYTNLIIVNVPGTRWEYENGYGEGCWVKVSDACKRAYDSDLGAPFGGEGVLKFHGVLNEDSWEWPPLTSGNHIVFEMRGVDKPVVPIDWLIASCPTCAAEKGLVGRESMDAIGESEYEAEFGEPLVFEAEPEPPAARSVRVVETWRQGAKSIDLLKRGRRFFIEPDDYDYVRNFTSLEEAKEALHLLLSLYYPDAVRTGDLHTGKWRFRLVREGERYGAGGRFIYGKETDSVTGEPVNRCQEYGLGLPMVEFYDESQDPEEADLHYAPAAGFFDCDMQGAADIRGIRRFPGCFGWTFHDDDGQEWSLTADEATAFGQWINESILDSDIAAAYARAAAKSKRLDVKLVNVTARIWGELKAFDKSTALQVFSLVMDELEKVAPEAGGIPDKYLRRSAADLNNSGYLSNLSAGGVEMDKKMFTILVKYPEFADLLNASIQAAYEKRGCYRPDYDYMDFIKDMNLIRGELERSPAFKELVSPKEEKAPSATLSAEKEAVRGASRALAGAGARDDRPAEER